MSTSDKLGIGLLQIFEKGKGKKRIRLKGIISTEHRDRQGEVIMQDGLDCRPFLDYGWFNDNHSSKSNDVLGYPEKVYRCTVKGADGALIQATAVEGYLLPTKRGKELLELSEALSGDPRRSLGFSVEGQIAERNETDQSVITCAVIKNVAITHVPVNPNTTLEALSKGMSSSSISALMPESLEGGSPKSLDYNPIIRASVIAQNHKTEIDMSATDYLSMFKMMPENERDAMMAAYNTFAGDNESEENDIDEPSSAAPKGELEKMQEASDRELGLVKAISEDDQPPLLAGNEPSEDPDEADTEDPEEAISKAETSEEIDTLLAKGLEVIEQAVTSDLDISDLSQYLNTDDVQSATEIDASGFLKSLVDSNKESLGDISKSLNDFRQQQRATNLTVLAVGRIVKGLQSQLENLNSSLSQPIMAKGASSVPQAQAMRKSFEGETNRKSLSKSEILNNLQGQLVKNMDNTNFSAQITDAIIRFESTGAISDEMMALANKQ